MLLRKDGDQINGRRPCAEMSAVGCDGVAVLRRVPLSVFGQAGTVGPGEPVFAAQVLAAIQCLTISTAAFNVAFGGCQGAALRTFFCGHV